MATPLIYFTEGKGEINHDLVASFTQAFFLYPQDKYCFSLFQHDGNWMRGFFSAPNVSIGRNSVFG